jgi:2-C-methyl-D-erythritol 4-phosphate cytidylyltransferase
LKKAAIVVAGGTGTRMKEGVPKQFLLLGSRPLLMYSLEAFYITDPEIRIIVALPEDHIHAWNSLCREYRFTVPHSTVSGGETRFHSVSNALGIIEGDGLVAIHDGARPLVTASLISRTFETAGRLGNCIPVLTISESLRIVENDITRPVNRHDYRIVQTPQVFRISEIQSAYRQDYRSAFTDDATVLESTGKTIHLVEGEPTNIKVTHGNDLFMAEFLLGKRR